MRAAHCLAALILLMAREGWAQRPPIPAMDPRYFRVDFIIPGARPSGLAGAFIGAAQDELSSSINPAGMTYLRRPAISTHQRFSHLVYEEPEGTPENPDATREFHTDSFEQSMANLIYPIEHFAVSLFREVPVNSHFEFETQPFLTTSAPVTARQVYGGLGSFPGRRVDLDLEMVDDGLALAYAPAPRVSLGFTFRLSFLNLRLTDQVFLDPALRASPAPRQNSADTIYSITTLDDTELGPSYDFGFLANLIRDKLFFGAVAHLRPRYTFHSDIYAPAFAADSVVVLPAQWTRDAPFEFSIPDSQGLGLYYAASDRLRFALDLARIEYSDLLDGNSTNAVADDSFDTQTGKYTDPDGQPDLVADDEYEIHLGVEFLAKIPGFSAIVPLRAGAFTNPGHRVYAASDDPDLRRLFPKGDDHIVFGLGVGIIQMGNFKLDTSVLLSEDGTSATGSAYVAF